MNDIIVALVFLAVGVIGGVIGGYFVYRNNKAKMDEIICRYDKEMCQEKEDCGC